MKKFLQKGNAKIKFKFLKMTRSSHSFCMSKFVLGFILCIFLITYVYDGSIIAFDNPMGYLSDLSNRETEMNMNPKCIDGYFANYFNYSNIENYFYTSKDIKPYVNVYYNNPNYIKELLNPDYENYLDRTIDSDKGVLLKYNVDYTIEYLGDKNGSLKNAGTHYIKICGIGEFSGSKIISFSVLPCQIDLSKLRCHDENNIDYYYISRDNNNLISKERDGNASCINDANDMILYYKNNSDYIKFTFDDAKFTKISQAKNNERVDAYIANCNINDYNSLLDVSFKNVTLSSNNNELVLNNYIIKEDKNITDGYNAIISKIGIITDTSMPKLVSISSPNNTFKYGDAITFDLVFDEEVKLNDGYIALKIKANPNSNDTINNQIVSEPIILKLNASKDNKYSKTKKFTYRVQRNDMALNNIKVVSIDLKHGYLTDLYQHEVEIDDKVIDEYNKSNKTYIDTNGYNITINAFSEDGSFLSDNDSKVSMTFKYKITLSEKSERDLTINDIKINFGEITKFNKLDDNKYEVEVNIANVLGEEILNENSINKKDVLMLTLEIKGHIIKSIQSNKMNSGKTFTIRIKDESIFESKNELIDEINTYMESKNKFSIKAFLDNKELLKKTYIRVGIMVSNLEKVVDAKKLFNFFLHIMIK